MRIFPYLEPSHKAPVALEVIGTCWKVLHYGGFHNDSTCHSKHKRSSSNCNVYGCHGHGYWTLLTTTNRTTAEGAMNIPQLANSKFWICSVMCKVVPMSRILTVSAIQC